MREIVPASFTSTVLFLFTLCGCESSDDSEYSAILYERITDEYEEWYHCTSEQQISTIVAAVERDLKHSKKMDYGVSRMPWHFVYFIETGRGVTRSVYVSGDHFIVEGIREGTVSSLLDVIGEIAKQHKPKSYEEAEQIRIISRE